MIKSRLAWAKDGRYSLEFHEESFTLVVVALMYMFLKTYWTVHLKSVHFLIWKWYLDKTDFFFFKANKTPTKTAFVLTDWSMASPHPPLALYLFYSLPVKREKNYYLFIWLCQVLVVACGTFSCSTWDLVPWLGVKRRPPALGEQSQPLDHQGSPRSLSRSVMIKNLFSK